MCRMLKCWPSCPGFIGLRLPSFHQTLDFISLQWRHNECDGISNHQPHNCLLNHLFRRRSKKASKLRVLAFVRGIHRCLVNSPHKGPVTRKVFPFDDVIMSKLIKLTTKKASKLCITQKPATLNITVPLCRKSTAPSGFPAQRADNVKSFAIRLWKWWLFYSLHPSY